jgi:hypothetical protein
MLSLPPRSATGEPGSEATAHRFEAEISTFTSCRFRQIVLGALATFLAWVKAGIDSCPAGDSRTLAQGWIQVVLGVAFATSNSGGQEVRQH